MDRKIKMIERIFKTLYDPISDDRSQMSEVYADILTDLLSEQFITQEEHDQLHSTYVHE